MTMPLQYHAQQQVKKTAFHKHYDAFNEATPAARNVHHEVFHLH